MGVYAFDGRSTYTGTNDDDQFYMRDATVPIVTIYGFEGTDYVQGSNLSDVIYGGGGRDYIYSGAGSDTIYGGQGDDVLYGDIDDGQGRLQSDQSPDAVYGEDGDDFIYIGYLDTAYGGVGNDVYVTLGGRSIVEQPNEGIDTVYAQYGYTLPDNVENLIISGLLSVPSGVGNALDNVMRISNDGLAGQLSGLDGNDLLYGTDRDGDHLWGGNGNDTLIGGAGGDFMAGGRGNDIYSVDAIGDLIEELPDGGYDEVYSSVDFQLFDNLETLFLTGTATYGTGNSFNNAIIGNDANNVIDAGAGAFEFINGAGGNDILIGGAGHDEIMGGAGNDIFRFTTASEGPDFFYDFTPGQDHIQLNAASFGIGTAANPLVTGVSFIEGTNVTSAVPTLLYNQANGYLFYDQDGTGANAPSVLALLNGTPALHVSDFLFY